jgi:hypothetical protein
MCTKLMAVQMDCWWNAAVENQGTYMPSCFFLFQHVATAIDRVHRIGQEKTVYVTHFIVGVLIVLMLRHSLMTFRPRTR